MTPLYQEIISKVDIEVREEDKAYIDSYWWKANLLHHGIKVLMFLSLLYAFIDLFIDLPWEYFGIAIGIVLTGIYNIYKGSVLGGIVKHMNDRCDTDKTMSGEMALIRHHKEEQGWSEHLYIVARALFYAGRFEDCTKVLKILERYCGSINTEDANGRRYYLILSIRMAYQKKDAVLLKLYATELEELVQGSRNKNLKSLVQAVLRYPALLELENQGQYEALYEKLNKDVTNEARLSQVSRHYLLYQMAQKAGMVKEAKKHREFVLEHGGTTFYKSELEPINE